MKHEPALCDMCEKRVKRASRLGVALAGICKDYATQEILAGTAAKDTYDEVLAALSAAAADIITMAGLRVADGHIDDVERDCARFVLQMNDAIQHIVRTNPAKKENPNPFWRTVVDPGKDVH